MNFEKKLIEKNEGAIAGELHQLEAKKQYFQNYVNKVIALGIIVNENDLIIMFENPKEYIVDKLTAGENMQVGGLKLNKEKLFDLIEKPAGTNEIIQSIEKDLMDRGIREHNIWSVKNFNVNANKVVVNPEYLENVNTRFSLFIENENQNKAYEKLQTIALLVNEINQLDGLTFKLSDELSDLFKISNGAFVTKPELIKQFK
jgi:hypothetical protein